MTPEDTIRWVYRYNQQGRTKDVARSVIVGEDGNIYLLDGQLSEIQVFAPDGEHVDTLGRQGEGPGEFMNGARLFWTPRGELTNPPPGRDPSLLLYRSHRLGHLHHRSVAARLQPDPTAGRCAAR